MDYALLRSWLALPPGPWPPDHYTLLGLESGHYDLGDIEAIVLRCMDRIRIHQLLHPELVTEGMNRLAQALICLTDPVAKIAYDAELGLTLPPVSPTSTVPAPTPTPAIELPFYLGLTPPETEPADDPTPEPERPAYEVVDEKELPSGEPPIIEAELVSAPVVVWEARTRRDLFARLAQLRRFLAAWRKLEPVFADPRESLNSPVLVLALLDGIEECRPLLDLLPELIAQPGRPGALVAALLRQRFVLPTLRTLLLDQRRAVARDWQFVERAVVREHHRLRELVRSGRPRRLPRQRPGKLLRWVARTPELVALAAALAALIVVLLRGRVGP